ncbi:hypothetical protein [Thioclava sp. ES.031]|uniref:hypothetical protein n=1 Tax=Thioclava sp. ES.031 TaxID=1798203 RepID=UPI001145BF57|nr:hypothetical protein [Thioclava sp. ES.031]
MLISRKSDFSMLDGEEECISLTDTCDPDDLTSLCSDVLVRGVGMDPLSFMRIGFEAARIGLEAQAVISMRVAGMMGLWDVSPLESLQMVQEKPVAVAAAAEAAAFALLRGQTADRAISASITQIGNHTSANMTRLSRRGPSWL